MKRLNPFPEKYVSGITGIIAYVMLDLTKNKKCAMLSIEVIEWI